MKLWNSLRGSLVPKVFLINIPLLSLTIPTFGMTTPVMNVLPSLKKYWWEITANDTWMNEEEVSTIC